MRINAPMVATLGHMTGPSASPRNSGPGWESGSTAYPSPLRIERGLKTSERVATALVSEIVNSQLQAGDRLPNEAAMVEQFQVGRGSLREALRILEVHGLISMRSGPGGGPVITAVDPRDVARTFSLYLHLRGAKVRELIEASLFMEPMIAIDPGR
jgi:GntR family transcriptional repressor for pyruvate dehydrogenase complex